jgi:hypothetical protein
MGYSGTILFPYGELLYQLLSDGNQRLFPGNKAAGI